MSSKSGKGNVSFDAGAGGDEAVRVGGGGGGSSGSCASAGGMTAAAAAAERSVSDAAEIDFRLSKLAAAFRLVSDFPDVADSNFLTRSLTEEFRCFKLDRVSVRWNGCGSFLQSKGTKVDGSNPIRLFYAFYAAKQNINRLGKIVFREGGKENSM